MKYPADRPKLSELKLLRVEPEELEKRNEEIKSLLANILQADVAKSRRAANSVPTLLELARCYAGVARPQATPSTDLYLPEPARAARV